MPKVRITKRTEQILLMRKKNTGLSNPKLIELAVIQFPQISLKELNIKIKIKKK